MTTPTAPQLPAFIRTYVPLGVAALIGWLASIGVLLPAAASDGLVVFLSALAGALWYAAVRYLEAKWPALGVLLGSTKTPVYDPIARVGVRLESDFSDSELAALRAVRDALQEGDEAREAIESILPPRHLEQ